MDALRAAYNEAQTRLSNPNCANLFTDWYNRFLEEQSFRNHDGLPPEVDVLKYEPSEVLRDVTFRFLPLGAPFIDVAGNIRVIGASTGTRSDSFINDQGTFLNRTLQVSGRTAVFDFAGRTTSLTQAQYGALLSLHELGHAYGEVGGIMNFFGPDAADVTLNREHTERVINSCFPELNATP